MPKAAHHSHEERVKHHQLAVQSLRAKADAKRSLPDKVADALTSRFGTITFLFLNAIWFAVWILINTDSIPGIEPFDPYPFGLLTMIVSLEAIMLAIFVLISQNRQAKVAELREEVDLQVTSIAETEVSKAIAMLQVLLEKNGVKMDDPEIAEMTMPIRSAEIEHSLEKQLEK